MREERKNPEDFRTVFRNMAASSLRRKSRAEKGKRVVMSALGTFGMIGWLVITPVVLFTIAGVWLEKKLSSTFPWALVLILAGVVLGCVMAWRWIDRSRPK